MRIAIVSAMAEEISGINSLSLSTKEEIFGGRIFQHKKINTIDCITAITHIGKVAAAQTISTLITRYEPTYVIVIGTAGSLHKDVNIGDIVISDQLFQHDVDLRPFRPRFELGILGKTFFKADECLIQYALEASQIFIQSTEFAFQKNTLNSFGITTPKIIKGSITSGDTFFSELYENYRSELIKLMPQVLAAEMEGAAIAQVCEDMKIPFIVIRFISDKADHSAVSNHTDFVSKIAAWYGKAIIENLFKKFI